ncbi:hypothetical protein ABIA39_005984 [Nocardia sp. GAS34]|uniref:hypothetical protein n=1 Tax=unclassified Nocardia TaxID=2637762 RepID=UPI003D2376C0
MKTTLFTALAVPFMFAIPVVAHADPSGPPSIFSPQQECDSTRTLVNNVHKFNPNLKTPDQIVDAYIKLQKLDGLNPVTDPRDPNNNRLRQFTRDHMKSCNIH